MRTAGRMTPEQRDFLRKQIDAQMRERLERDRSAKEQAKTEALERQTLREAVASADRPVVPNDEDVEVVTVGGEGFGEDHRRETRNEARLRARQRLQKVCDEGLQTQTGTRVLTNS